MWLCWHKHRTNAAPQRLCSCPAQQDSLLCCPQAAWRLVCKGKAHSWCQQPPHIVMRRPQAHNTQGLSLNPQRFPRKAGGSKGVQRAAPDSHSRQCASSSSRSRKPPHRRTAVQARHLQQDSVCVVPMHGDGRPPARPHTHDTQSHSPPPRPHTQQHQVTQVASGDRRQHHVPYFPGMQQQQHSPRLHLSAAYALPQCTHAEKVETAHGITRGGPCLLSRVGVRGGWPACRRESM